MIGSIEEDSVYYLVKIHSDLHPTVAFDLEEILLELKEKIPKHTLFDMHKVNTCSNSALGVLIEYAHYLSETGNEVIFFGLSETLEHNFFSHNLIEDIIPRKESKEEAVKYLEETQKIQVLENAKKTSKIKQIKLDESLKEISAKALYETKRMRFLAKNNAEVLNQIEKTEDFFKSIAEKTKIRKLSTTGNYGTIDEERWLDIIQEVLKNLDDLNKKYLKIENMLNKIMKKMDLP
ncbi:MAG: hypothetical protein HUU50_08335 [Candidatus Brocadiae bacterium]|nr:hypothetical protein [Candidatus Brocadiia bacterium]